MSPTCKSLWIKAPAKWLNVIFRATWLVTGAIQPRGSNIIFADVESVLSGMVLSSGCTSRDTKVLKGLWWVLTTCAFWESLWRASSAYIESAVFVIKWWIRSHKLFYSTNTLRVTLLPRLFFFFSCSFPSHTNSSHLSFSAKLPVRETQVL